MQDKRIKWLNNANMTSWWLSWDDLRWPADDVITRWERRADIYQQAGVNAVTTFGIHFRWDWLNYFDKYDAMLRNLVEICHARGIKVIDHHSNQLTHHIRTQADRVRIANLQDHHLPLFPDSWEKQTINGNKLADWRMVSAKTKEPVYIETYCAEAFCPNNPDYQAEYYAYLKRLVKNTGIDGVMSDDTAFHPDIYSCACEHCRKKFEQRTEELLPEVDDLTFWENYESPLFQEWIQMRYESIADFYQGVKNSLSPEIALFACSCNDPMPHKVRQGCSMELWASSMDFIFAEMYHAFGLEDHLDDIICDLATVSSIAGYTDKQALILAYSDDIKILNQWATLCQDYGARPWFCRQVRKIPVILEEETLKRGYPEVKVDAAKPYGCGIVHSRKLKNKSAEADRTYYNNFKEIVITMHNSGYRPQIIFDDLKPDNPQYKTIYVPMHDKLDNAMKQYLSTTGCNIKTGL